MSRSFDEHLQHLDILFYKLRKANLVVNKEKCEFRRYKIKFLGHIILEKGMCSDSKKIQIIVNFPLPTKMRDIRAFISLTGRCV